MSDKRVSRRNVLQTAAVAGLAPLLTVGSAEANVAGPGGARGYARGPHGQVHYHDNQGASAMPLLLLHQAPMSHRQFDAVYGPLKTRGIRAIGIDMPGFGMSDPTPFVPKVADWASSVAAVLDHLRIRQADVLGHHTGALLATEVALQFPQRVRRVILNGPFPITESERAMFLADLQKTEIDFEYRADGTHLSESFVKRSKFYGPDADPRHITRIQVEKFMGYGPFWYGHHAAFEYDHAAAIMKIRRPTLILTNTGDQIYENSKVAHRMRPDFAFHAVPGGGIDIMDQEPEAWVEAIDRFLRIED